MSKNEDFDSPRSGTVRSVQRAARIITALAEHPYPMGIAELAQRVMLSPASVHRMLATLISVGWVDQNTRTAKYRLGTRMLGIGSTGLITSPVVQNGRVFLNRLARQTLPHVLAVVVRPRPRARGQILDELHQGLIAFAEVDGVGVGLRVVDAGRPVDLDTVVFRVTEVATEGDAVVDHTVDLAA